MISFDGAHFCARSVSTRAEVQLLIRAGFWSTEDGAHYFGTAKAAVRLREHCDESAQVELNRKFLHISPWSGRLAWPKGLTPEYWQLKTARFILSRNRSYAALDPGLGKTIVACLVMRALKGRALFVYICPPFLVLNVKEEIEKWCGIDQLLSTDVIPDSLLTRERVQKIVEDARATRKTGAELFVFVDEAHRYKTDTAKRTKALFKTILPNADRVAFLSGTPMPNRPMELYPVLSHAAPETINFMERFTFGKTYCNGYLDPKTGHWNFSGASNMEKLAASIIPKFMIRIRDHVLKLPPVREEMILIGENLPPLIRRLDAAVLKEHSPEDLMAGKMSSHISTYRRELATAKVWPALSVIRGILDSSDEKVIIFGHHREALSELTRLLKKYTPLVITGDTASDARVAIARAFNEYASRRLLIANIQAGGIGLNMTAASRVIFLEFSWVPAENTQAFKRAHRYGQTGQVLVQYLVFKNSIDRRVMETALRKSALNQHI